MKYFLLALCSLLAMGAVRASKGECARGPAWRALTSCNEKNTEIGNPVCLWCERLVRDVEKKVINNKSKDNIKRELKKACRKIKNKKMRAKCVRIVEKKADFIVDAIIKDVPAIAICTALHFCFGEELLASHAMQSLSRTIDAKFSGKPQCAVCELIMTRLDTELKDKKTQDEIRTSVLKICSKMPKKMAPKCKRFVKKYADVIIARVSTVPPKEICGEINLCLTKKKHIAKITECGVCRATTQALAKYMKKNEIKDRDYVVEKVCGKFPRRYFSRCEKFLSTHVETLEHLIERSEKLSVICDKIGFCSANDGDSHFGRTKRELEYEEHIDKESCDPDEFDEPHDAVDIKPGQQEPW